MAYRTLDEHLFGEGPKRLLALDGGGIRGALSLGYLGRIETMLRRRNGDDPAFRLCDYFDLIGGTSTGSIIATGLALGYSVAEVHDVYKSLAHKVFERDALRFGVFSSKFAKEPLIDALTSYFGDETLGSDALRTGLMVAAKRLDTDSAWFLHNNPRGKFFAGDADGAHIPNRDLPLTTIVRASTAAPHYFEPELIQIAPGEFGAFIDGAVSPFNNPALQLVMLATLSGYGFNWPLGADRLLLVSVGTGFGSERRDPRDVMDMKALELATHSIRSSMDDANWLTQAMLQWMAHSPTPWQIDAEVGDLHADLLGPAPMLSYLRYDVAIEPQWLDDHLGLIRTLEDCVRLRAMDAPANTDELHELGGAAADVQILDEHFPQVFDL